MSNLNNDNEHLEERTNVEVSSTEKYTTVGGWLLLLCISLTILSPLVILYGLITAYDETHYVFALFPGVQMVFYADALLSVLIIILCIRAGISLWTIRPNAVKIAKNFLLIYLGYLVIAAFLPFLAGLPAEANKVMMPEITKSILRGLIYVAIWYLYLSVSKRVKQTYIYNELEDNDSEEETIENFDKK